MPYKTNGQRTSDANPNPLAVSWVRSSMVERPTVNRLVTSSTLAAPATLFSPVRSFNCEQALASGNPKAELLRLTAFLDPSPAKSKVKNDLSQLPSRMPEVWEA